MLVEYRSLNDINSCDYRDVSALNFTVQSLGIPVDIPDKFLKNRLAMACPRRFELGIKGLVEKICHFPASKNL